MNFAERLKEIRTKRSVTQDELAEYLNITKNAISMYENGKRTPDYETLEGIADFFNVDTDWLLGREVGSTYYLDPEVAVMAQEVYDNPELKMLFSASRNLSKEDLQAVVDLVKRLKGND